MSQDIRRRLRARQLISPAARAEDEVPAPLRIRRFSEGVEHPELEGAYRFHLGRFSEGAEWLPD